MSGPLLDYFREMREVAHTRVAVVETNAREGLVSRVTEALERLTPEPPDSLLLLDHMADWLRPHSPTA